MVNKGLCFGELGRHEEALECFDKALEIEPENESALKMRELIISNTSGINETSSTTTVTLDEAKNMRQGINVEGTVERKEEVRTVNTKAGLTIDVTNAYLVDNEMEIKITLWEEDANNIQNGDRIKIENGYTTEFQGEIQLAKGKSGKIEKI